MFLFKLTDKKQNQNDHVEIVVTEKRRASTGNSRYTYNATNQIKKCKSYHPNDEMAKEHAYCRKHYYPDDTKSTISSAASDYSDSSTHCRQHYYYYPDDTKSTISSAASDYSDSSTCSTVTSLSTKSANSDRRKCTYLDSVLSTCCCTVLNFYDDNLGDGSEHCL